LASASGSRRGNSASQSLYVALTLLLADYLRLVSYTCFSDLLQAARGRSGYPDTAVPTRAVHRSRSWPIVAPSRATARARRPSNGRPTPERRRRRPDRQGTQRPLRPPLVHRRARPAEELLDQLR